MENFLVGSNLVIGETVFPKELSMVGGHHKDRSIEERLGAQGLDKLAKSAVDVGNLRVVGREGRDIAPLPVSSKDMPWPREVGTVRV